MSEVLLKEDNLIDLGSADSAGDFLFEITRLLEQKNLRDRSIKVNLGAVNFSLNQLENLLSVLRGFGIEIEMVYSEIKETKIAAIELGLTVSGQNPLQECPGQTNSEEQNTQISGEEVLENILWEGTESGEVKKETLYVKQTLRSGQKLEFDGNLIIIGDCNAGSEVIASGDIVVWGILSGIAHAGNKGDKKVCIRAFKINAIQLRIADLLARKPDRINIDKVEKSDLFNPEEAKITDGEIVIYSLHQDSY